MQSTAEKSQSQQVQAESGSAKPGTDPHNTSPSFTQMMRDALSSDHESESEAESIYVESESTPNADHPPAPKPPPKPKNVDKSTSPNHTRFVESDKKKTSSIKKPSHRPAQKSVNDMKSRKTTGDSDNESDKEGTWETVSSKNKYKKKSADKCESSGLKGIKSEPFAELYLTNIARQENKSLSDIAEDIRKYGRGKGFRIMSAWVVSNRVTDDMVGCKLRVPMRQVDDMLGNRAWPDGIMCKRWEKRERSDKSGPPFTAYHIQQAGYNPTLPPFTFPRNQQAGYNPRPRSASRRRQESPRRRSSSRGSTRGRSSSRQGHFRNSRSNSQRRSRRDWFDERD